MLNVIVLPGRWLEFFDHTALPVYPRAHRTANLGGEYHSSSFLIYCDSAGFLGNVVLSFQRVCVLVITEIGPSGEIPFDASDVAMVKHL